MFGQFGQFDTKKSVKNKLEVLDCWNCSSHVFQIFTKIIPPPFGHDSHHSHDASDFRFLPSCICWKVHLFQCPGLNATKADGGDGCLVLLPRWKDLETLQKVGKDEAFEINKLGASGLPFSIGGVFLRAEKVGEIEEFRGNLETLEARCRRRRRKISTSAFGWPVASSWTITFFLFTNWIHIRFLPSQSKIAQTVGIHCCAMMLWKCSPNSCNRKARLSGLLSQQLQTQLSEIVQQQLQNHVQPQLQQQLQAQLKDWLQFVALFQSFKKLISLEKKTTQNCLGIGSCNCYPFFVFFLFFFGLEYLKEHRLMPTVALVALCQGGTSGGS